MATITSTTSGNFNATTTWVGGVVPVDGDSFYIATGHTVIYNVTTPVTNGFNDSDIYGILQHQASVNTILRMNGRLRVRTAGTYHMRAGAKLQFKGTAAESHILYVVGESGASFIAEGSDGMPATTLSAAANERSTSFTVVNATNFAVGEWISVFDNVTAQASNAGATSLRDEGFWIHDISGNTIYFRQYVGPQTTITSGSGTSVIVANSKVLRVGQIIIFGTGVNRNVLTITAINYSTHTLTLSAAITGTIAGLTVYETGTDKIHSSGEKVRKVATVTTVAAVAADTTITVANANTFAAGDEIWVEARSEAANNQDRQRDTYSTYMKTVSSVAGNVLTLTGTIGYNLVVGTLITRLTRDVIVEPVTPNTDYYGVYFEAYSATYNRKFIVKDVYFRYNGSSAGQAEGGVWFNSGHASTNSPAVTLTQQVPAWSQQPWIEGVTLLGSNSSRDLGGLWIYGRYHQARCCTVVGSYDSSIALWYQAGVCAYNCITSGGTWGYRCEGNSEWSEFAYCYSSRHYYGLRLTLYDGNCGVHHIIMDATDQPPSMFSMAPIPLYKINITGGTYGLALDKGTLIFLYSKYAVCSGFPKITDNPPGTYQRGYYHSQIDRGNAGIQVVTILEDNYEYDRVRQLSYGTERYWDAAENAWRVVNAVDFADYGNGWFTSVYVPPNVVLRVACAVKLAVGFSGTYPRLEARSVQSAVGPNQLGNAGGDWSSTLSGGYSAIDYTSTAASAYENAQLTIAAKPFPRYIQVGVHCSSSTSSEGWWMKSIDTYLNTPYPNKAFEVINRDSGSGNLAIENSFIQNKVRIGGRIM